MFLLIYVCPQEVLPSHNAMGQADLPKGRPPRRQTPLRKQTSHPYDQQADGTHPTGMHPCYIVSLVRGILT